jgi:hypothetical protein
MYIDPNTGGMLFQILLAVFGVISAVVLIFSGRIRQIFARLRRKIRERRLSGSDGSTPEEETPPPAA